MDAYIKWMNEINIDMQRVPNTMNLLYDSRSHDSYADVMELRASSVVRTY